MSDHIITYADAIQEALTLAMEADPNVVVFGLDVDDHKRIYGTTAELVERFGRGRVFGTPLSEDAMTGVAVGMALAGLRPVHVHIRMDFTLLGMNQLVNMAAKLHYMSGGQVKVPLVVRSIIGKSWGQGAQHSQGLHGLFTQIPGLKVVAPTTPYDAKGCLMEAILDDNPVMFVEHRLLYQKSGPVPETPYRVPFGRARILRKGSRVTLVGISYMVDECLRAARLLEQVDIDAEVIDPMSLSPLDMDTIETSVAVTQYVVVVDCGWVRGGIAAEIVAQLLVRHHWYCDCIGADYMGFADAPCPTARRLEAAFYPTARTIARKVIEMRYGSDDVMYAKLDSLPDPDPPEPFRGPF